MNIRRAVIVFLKSFKGHKGRPGQRGGSTPRDDHENHRIKHEKRQIRALLNSTLADPLTGPFSALVSIKTSDLEILLPKGPAIERDGEIVVSGKALKRAAGTEKGFGLVIILWKHGEMSGKERGSQINRGDILALPHVARTEPIDVQKNAQGETIRWEWWRVRYDGKIVVYAASKFLKDGGEDNCIVTIHVHEEKTIKKALRISPPTGMAEGGYTPNTFQSLFGGQSAFQKSTLPESELFLKAIPAGARWITVHPNGEDSKGVPVLVKESTPGTGVYHVIGGAGGKLNYLKLRGVKSEEHYREESAEKRREAQEKERARVKADKAAGVHQAKQDRLGEVAAARKESEKRYIQATAQALGWKDEDLKPSADKLEGLSDKERQAVADEHHRALLGRAKEAEKIGRNWLANDPAAREDAGLDRIGVGSDGAAALDVSDLDPVAGSSSGLGFAPKYKERSDVGKEHQPKEAGEDAPPATESGAATPEGFEQTAGEIKPESDLPTANIQEASQALDIIKARKELAASERAAKKAASDIKQGRASPDPTAYILEASKDVDLDEKARKSIEDDVRTMAAHGFLGQVSEVGGRDYAKSMRRHLGVGAYNGFNSVALNVAGQGLLDRSVVDALGIQGAAEAMAARLRSDLGHDKCQDIAGALERYHLDNSVEATTEALQQVESLRRQVESMEIPDAVDSAGIADAFRINRARMEAVESMKEALGTTLGEQEATAAMIVALRRDAAGKPLKLPMGKVGRQGATERAKAIGLEDGDFEIATDADGAHISVNPDAIGKLTTPIDRDHFTRLKTSLDIQTGKQDEEGWLPVGMARRPDLLSNAQMGVADRMAEPFSPGEDLGKNIKDYIGGRMADGDAPAQIVADLRNEDLIRTVPEGSRGAYFEALRSIAPVIGEDGKPVKADSYEEKFQGLADRFVSDRFGNDRSPLHRQRLDQGVAVEALHRTLGSIPEGKVAFTPIGDLDHEGRGILRQWFANHIARDSPEAQQLSSDLEALRAKEPQKMTRGFFGEAVSTEWEGWNKRVEEMQGQLSGARLGWDGYIRHMGSREAAYAAIQDHINGAVSREFSQHYNRIHEDPLKIGSRSIRGDLEHLDAVDPDARRRRDEIHRQEVDRLRNRLQGKYTSGGVSEKLAQSRAAREALDQAQMSLFMGEKPQAESSDPTIEAGQRFTLGHAAERQLASLVGNVGRNFRPGEKLPFTFARTMDGKYINQQRAVKLIEANRRIQLAQGVGSGKTTIGLTGFAHLQGQGKAKRGLFVVPSIVQGQFNGEALTNLEPGKFQWHAEPGASREERLNALRNPENHFVVVTHQSLRDDLVHLGAAHEGITEDEMVSRIAGMSREERKEWSRGVFEKEGIGADYVMVDEGHDLLNRSGKANSTMANVIDGVTDNANYYVNATADPAKNDTSEVFDLLSKLDPDRYSDRDAFMRRYGVNTPASQDELRRELAAYLYPGRISSGVSATESEVNVPLSKEQHADMSRLEAAIGRATAARIKGGVDVEAMKEISPSSFSGVPTNGHEALAQSLQRNLGILKGTAVDKILNEHPKGAKAGEVSRIAQERKGKPGIVFARSLSAVKTLSERLTSEGHKVIVLTGADSTKEKNRKRQAFARGDGDILVASDAGAVGLNAQRGKWLVQYDTPDTAKTHAQRNGRIDRLGQTGDVELIDLVADHQSEKAARDRLAKKYGLRETLTSPFEGIDDTGLASYLDSARSGDAANDQKAAKAS